MIKYVYSACVPYFTSCDHKCKSRLKAFLAFSNELLHGVTTLLSSIRDYRHLINPMMNYCSFCHVIQKKVTKIQF